MRHTLGALHKGIFESKLGFSFRHIHVLSDLPLHWISAVHIF